MAGQVRVKRDMSVQDEPVFGLAFQNEMHSLLWKAKNRSGERVRMLNQPAHWGFRFGQMRQVIA